MNYSPLHNSSQDGAEDTSDNNALLSDDIFDDDLDLSPEEGGDEDKSDLDKLPL